MGLREMLGPVTVVTGLEKGSGKTSLVNLALPIARESGPVGVFTIGLDGGTGRPDDAPSIDLAPGDVTITTDKLARGAKARLEVLDVLPGRSALGRLVLVRAVRGGAVTVIGPEHLATLGDVVTDARTEGWVDRVLVDGSVNRVTHVAALDAEFLCTARVEPANLRATARRLRTLEDLADLPEDAHPSAEVTTIEGPLTASTVAGFGREVRAISIADLTQCFLDPDATSRLLDRLQVSVRRRLNLRGIVVGLRDVTADALAAALGRPLSSRYLVDPWAVAPC